MKQLFNRYHYIQIIISHNFFVSFVHEKEKKTKNKNVNSPFRQLVDILI